MRRPSLLPIPREFPKPLLELCAHLEERGIPAYSQGEGLLANLRRPAPPVDAPPPRHSLLCAVTPYRLLRALPRAVVTSEGQSRITQATTAGPVDLFPTGERPIETAFLAFGLGPLAFGHRPADQSWCDPADQLEPFGAGRLEVAHATPNPFVVAPRRFWIAARLIAEERLEASDSLVAIASEAVPIVAERVPVGAPARREISRILASDHATPALAFLRRCGVSSLIVPGSQSVHEARVDQLPARPALRWAAWLRGSATASAMVRLRVPHPLARRVERLQATHPIDRSAGPDNEAGLRKLMRRLSPEDLEALFVWRRLELTESPSETEAREVESRLAALEDRIDQIRAAQARSGQIRALALDGRAVMEILGHGPGPHVGLALAHLVRHVTDQPETNEAESLKAELLDWARQSTNTLD